jgi:hypothetical protein
MPVGPYEDRLEYATRSAATPEGRRPDPSMHWAGGGLCKKARAARRSRGA